MLVLYAFRKSLRSFLMNMRLSDGSFIMHEGGECDIRLVVLINTRLYFCQWKIAVQCVVFYVDMLLPKI